MSLKQRIEKECHTPLSREANIFMVKRMLIDNIYNSAQLENIACTYAQTEEIVENNGCANLKPSEVTEILNLRDAWKFTLDEAISRKTDLSLFQDYHSIVSKGMQTLQWNEVGVFRTETVKIGGTKWLPEVPNVEECHKELIELSKIKNAVDRSLEIYLWSCRKQLFKDGNKRVSSFIANKELIQNGFGLFSIEKEYQSEFKQKLVEYYETNNNIGIKEFLYNYCYYFNGSGQNKASS